MIKFASDPGKIADLDQQRDTDIKKLEVEFSQIKEQRLIELRQKHKENQDKAKSQKEMIEFVTKKVRRSISRKASRGRTPKKSKWMKEDSYSPQQKILNFAVVNKEQLNTELSKGLNTTLPLTNNFYVKYNI